MSTNSTNISLSVSRAYELCKNGDITPNAYKKITGMVFVDINEDAKKRQRNELADKVTKMIEGAAMVHLINVNYKNESLLNVLTQVDGITLEFCDRSEENDYYEVLDIYDAIDCNNLSIKNNKIYWGDNRIIECLNKEQAMKFKLKEAKKMMDKAEREYNKLYDKWYELWIKQNPDYPSFTARNLPGNR